MATAIETKIKNLEDKLKQARQLAAKQAARERAKKEGERRKLETRKRVLLGAFIMDGGSDPMLMVNGKGQNLDQWLTRPDERALFGLEPIKPTE